MERFRLRTGELLGILGPGFFLLFDLHLVLTGNAVPRLPFEHRPGAGTAYDIVLVFGLFMAVYLTGFVLRLIPPGLLDWWSARLRSLDLSLSVAEKAGLSEAFPYIVWFRRVLTPGNVAGTASHLLRLREVLRAWPVHCRTRGRQDPKNARFNSYKQVVLSGEHPALANEVLFTEGLSRMVSGLAYAALISCTAAALVVSGQLRWHERSFMPLVVWMGFVLVTIWGIHGVQAHARSSRRRPRWLGWIAVGVGITGAVAVPFAVSGFTWSSAPLATLVPLVVLAPQEARQPSDRCWFLSAFLLVFVGACIFYMQLSGHISVIANLLLFALLVFSPRHLRVREAATVLNAYAIVVTSTRERQNQAAKQNASSSA